MGRSEPYGCYSRKLGRAVTPQQNTQMTVTLPITLKALLETLQLSRYEATQQGKPCKARDSGLQREAFPLSNCTTELNKTRLAGENRNEVFCTTGPKTEGTTKRANQMKPDVERGKANREAGPKYPVQGQSN